MAVVGSGPAGLAAAQQLTRAGHEVVLFEKDDRLGGLLRYGIPDFKLEKHVLDRRLEQMAAEGVKFEPGVARWAAISQRPRTAQRFDAIVPVHGRRHAAAAGRARRRPARRPLGHGFPYAAEPPRGGRRDPQRQPADSPPSGKHVIVVGGGDTGSDCVGTSIRQGALSVTQLEILPRAAGGQQSRNALAVLAEDHAHLVFAGGRLPAPLERADQGNYRGETAACSALAGCEVDWVAGPQGLADEGACPARISRCRPTWC